MAEVICLKLEAGKEGVKEIVVNKMELEEMTKVEKITEVLGIELQTRKEGAKEVRSVYFKSKSSF